MIKAKFVVGLISLLFLTGCSQSNLVSSDTEFLQPETETWVKFNSCVDASLNLTGDPYTDGALRTIARDACAEYKPRFRNYAKPTSFAEYNACIEAKWNPTGDSYTDSALRMIARDSCSDYKP